MKLNNLFIHTPIYLATFFLMFLISCERSVSGLEEAPNSNNPDVFIDTFSSGLNYAAFEGSVLEAFLVVEDETYDNSEAAMRFEVPDVGDPRGSYAGGTFFTSMPRDLTGYNALTFRAKASETTPIGVLGIGIDLGENKFQAAVENTMVTTRWQKYTIPIPDPALLDSEQGLFFYSSGPIDEEGYTFWIDEVKFENLGTIVFDSAVILNGEEREFTGQNGQSITIDELATRHRLPDGTLEDVSASPYYYDFSSSDESVAKVSEDGVVTVTGQGTAVVTAALRGTDAEGSLTVTSTGEASTPNAAPPAPEQDPANVISMYTNVYDNVPVDTWNTGWEFSTATETFIQIENQDVIRYQNLNFVGIEFASQTIDASEMTHFRLDIWTPDPTELPNEFKVLLVDFGANDQFNGGDDSEDELTFTSPTLQTEQWVSLDIPLADFTGLQNRANLAQLVLSGDLPNIYLTNVYFYKGDDEGGNGGGDPNTDPPNSAPAPTTDDAAVLSLFSDKYNDVTVDTWRTEWSAAALEDIDLFGNPTKKYTDLDFVGIETTEDNLVDASEMEFMHIDVWTPNMDVLRIKLVDFGADGGFEGGDDSEFELILEDLPKQQWNSLKIPLSDFEGLENRSNLAQYILSGLPAGDGILYVDNVYFSKDDADTPPTEPVNAAPTPGTNDADVISIFSDAYENVDGTNLNPDWGQATVVTEEIIEENNTLKLAGLNYQGIELGGNLDVTEMTTLHIDYWTVNSTALSVFLISPGPVETPYTLTVPTSGWTSVDIPLSEFDPVELNEVFQFKFEGDGDIWIDNIYFKK